MASAALRIDPRQIGNLADAMFARFVNTLLRAEAGSQGVPQPLVDTTVNEKAKDQGIDASVGSHDSPGGDWLPAHASTWQYKSGKCTSAADLAKTEFRKPGVLAAVARGDSYVFCTADSITKPKREEIEAAIANLYVQHGLEPKGRVYAADKLAAWAEEQLAVAAEYFAIPIEGWQTAAQWACGFSNAFVSDASRDQLMAAVQSHVEAGAPPLLRVVGDDGVGKTRTVFEALQAPGFRERVLYFDDAERLDPRTLWYLKRTSGQRRAILVVDQCSSEEVPRIEKLAASLAGGCTLIAIGPRPPIRRPRRASPTASSAILELPPLSTETMSLRIPAIVITAIAPS